MFKAYTKDKQYRFVVYDGTNYTVVLQKKLTDEYMEPDWFEYVGENDGIRYCHTLERAKEIGAELLKNAEAYPNHTIAIDGNDSIKDFTTVWIRKSMTNNLKKRNHWYIVSAS